MTSVLSRSVREIESGEGMVPQITNIDGVMQ
jgi:hypothetical protein